MNEFKILIKCEDPAHKPINLPTQGLDIVDKIREHYPAARFDDIEGVRGVGVVYEQAILVPEHVARESGLFRTRSVAEVIVPDRGLNFAVDERINQDVGGGGSAKYFLQRTLNRELVLERWKASNFPVNWKRIVSFPEPEQAMKILENYEKSREADSIDK